MRFLFLLINIVLPIGFIMSTTVKKSFFSLSNEQKKELTKAIFPFLEQSDIELAAKDIVKCLFAAEGSIYALTYTQSIRANMWLRENNLFVNGLSTDKSELN